MQAQDLAVNIVSTWAAVPRLVLGSVGIAGGFVSRVVIRAFTSTHGATRRPLKIRMQCGGHNINVRALGVDRGRGIAIGHGRGVGGGVRFRGDEGLREFGIILGSLGPLPALASQEEGWHSRLGLRLSYTRKQHNNKYSEYSCQKQDQFLHVGYPFLPSQNGGHLHSTMQGLTTDGILIHLFYVSFPAPC